MSLSVGPDNVIVNYVVGLGVLVPFVGALTRYKVNFTPKRIILDEEVAHGDNRAVHEVNGVWAMIKRVHKLDGMSGMYKGLMPVLITMLVWSAFYHVTSRADKFYAMPNVGKDERGLFILHSIPLALATFVLEFFQMILLLPALAIIYRAMITEEHLPFFNAFEAIHVLFSAVKLHKPWIIFATPGLMRARAFQLAWYVFVVRIARNLLLMANYWPYPVIGNPQPVEVVIYVIVLIISTFVLNPFEVIATRLTIQHYPVVAGEHARVHRVAEAMESAEEHIEDGIDYVREHMGHSPKPDDAPATTTTTAVSASAAPAPGSKIATTSKSDDSGAEVDKVTKIVTVGDSSKAGTSSAAVVATTASVAVPPGTKPHEHHRIIRKLERVVDEAEEELEHAIDRIKRAGFSVQRQWDGARHTAARLLGLEDIIRIPDPYLGVFDAFKRILHEEGFTTFYRGWWVMLIVLGLSTFAP